MLTLNCCIVIIQIDTNVSAHKLLHVFIKKEILWAVITWNLISSYNKLPRRDSVKLRAKQAFGIRHYQAYSYSKKTSWHLVLEQWPRMDISSRIGTHKEGCTTGRHVDTCKWHLIVEFFFRYYNHTLVLLLAIWCKEMVMCGSSGAYTIKWVLNVTNICKNWKS